MNGDPSLGELKTTLGTHCERASRTLALNSETRATDSVRVPNKVIAANNWLTIPMPSRLPLRRPPCWPPPEPVPELPQGPSPAIAGDRRAEGDQAVAQAVFEFDSGSYGQYAGPAEGVEFVAREGHQVDFGRLPG